jgi:hypothetical protein
MTNLSRRLRKLETRWTDASGLIPHTEAWFEHWMQKVDEVLRGGNPDLRGMPLAVIDTLIARAAADDRR